MDLISVMKQRYPLIYEISGRYYYLGMWMFRECSEEEKGLYDELRKELNFLRSMVDSLSHLQSAQVQKLSSLYKEIFEKERISHDDLNMSQTNEPLIRFLAGLDADQQASLSKQIDDYRSIMNLSEGAFYRESNR